MKKKSILLIVFLTTLITYPVSGETKQKKLTIMVYMCGSNLETLRGTASSDIQEMIDSGINSNVISLLVMTGGSMQWHMGFDISQISIHEIGSRGRRIVWHSEAKNMGYYGTLSQFLSFGKENYPADQYALIVWDHGGGPMEGICWDERFSPDNLRLQELVNGIKDADLGQKLSWIGFDACLMGSLEVAVSIAPYAEYMIASEETEPAQGWNYAFLTEIEKDADGAETGHRIIDAYFEGQDDNSEFLTMSCIDLAEVGQLTEIFNDIFLPLSENFTAENFPDFSEIRMLTREFGEGTRSNGEDTYDLVDAVDFLTRLSGNDYYQLFNKVVVYNRVNVSGANGLSLYHPYVNKNRYHDEWRDAFERINYSSPYTQYIKSFTTVLTGEELVDWHGLKTIDDGWDGEHHNRFSVHLSHEQAAHFASAQLVILANMDSGDYQSDFRYGNQKNYRKIYVSKAEMNEENHITASFSGKTLFVEDDSGIMDGPLSFEQTRDGMTNYLTSFYTTEEWPQPDLRVQYLFDPTSVDDYPAILNSRVFDEVTGTFTNRLDFDESDYKFLTFYSVHRFLKENSENSILQRFENWEINEDTFHLVKLQLPGNWRLRFSEHLLPGTEDLYAMFQITDLQQNVYCTMPIPIKNPNTTIIEVNTPIFDGETVQLELSSAKISGEINSGLMVWVNITNLTDQEIQFKIIHDSLIINDILLVERAKAQGDYRWIPAHGTDRQKIFIAAEQLKGLEQINAISFIGRVTDSLYNEVEKITPTFTMKN